MVPLIELWLPIVAAGVLVFVASSVVHMLLPLHRSDYAKLPNEELVLDAMRKHGVRPGQYMFPLAGSMKEMGTPEMAAKFAKGPVGTLIVRPSGPPSMGASLLQWFAYCLVMGLFTAYAASLVLPHGTDGRLVFRLTATIAFMGYGLYAASESIWKGLRWSTSAKFWLDGLIYGLVTGATFAWLWPAA